ncbi:hypothetical protein ILFOPFJJ_06582 [Ensifer psoraleae]|nr:hypothetical protein [Sinorhizobium psoraleae]
MVVNTPDTKAQATLNATADGKIAECLFAAQADEGNRNLLPVADALFPVWPFKGYIAEALLARMSPPIRGRPST